MVLSHNTLRDAIPTQKKSQPGILHTFSLRMLASMLNIYLLPNLASIEPPPRSGFIGYWGSPSLPPWVCEIHISPVCWVDHGANLRRRSSTRPDNPGPVIKMTTPMNEGKRPSCKQKTAIAAAILHSSVHNPFICGLVKRAFRRSVFRQGFLVIKLLNPVKNEKVGIATMRNREQKQKAG